VKLAQKLAGPDGPMVGSTGGPAGWLALPLPASQADPRRKLPRCRFRAPDSRFPML